jgi:hypothetical protein
MFDAGVQTALQKYTCWVLNELGRPLVHSFAVCHQHLAALLINFHTLHHRALAAYPNNLLFRLRRQAPSQRFVNGEAIDFTCAKSFELGSTSRVDALPYR